MVVEVDEACRILSTCKSLGVTIEHQIQFDGTPDSEVPSILSICSLDPVYNSKPFSLIIQLQCTDLTNSARLRNLLAGHEQLKICSVDPGTFVDHTGLRLANSVNLPQEARQYFTLSSIHILSPKLLRKKVHASDFQTGKEH